jgi:hypothetical protein
VADGREEAAAVTPEVPPAPVVSALKPADTSR